jgi:plastocyanin
MSNRPAGMMTARVLRALPRRAASWGRFRPVVVFYVIGGLTALWAVVLAALGITRHNFPGNAGGATIVMAVSGVLVFASVGSAVVTGALEEEEHGEEAEAAEAEAPEEAAAPEGEELELSTATGTELAFETDTLEAAAGAVTLVMENAATIEHNVALEGDGVSEEGEVVGEGETSTVSAEVEPGEYAFYCSVPGHREGGMEGTLTVE